MVAEFEFNGGIWKPDADRESKFLCYALVGGEEVSLFQMRKNGLADLVTKADENGAVRTYYATTVTNVFKVFVTDSFRGNRRWYSFYVTVKDRKSALITIRPFPMVGARPDDMDSGHFFRARGNFLTKNEALSLLGPDAPSRGYLQSQRLLPVPVLQKMVTIDRNVLREGVRVIRIGAKP